MHLFLRSNVKYRVTEIAWDVAVQLMQRNVGVLVSLSWCPRLGWQIRKFGFVHNIGCPVPAVINTDENGRDGAVAGQREHGIDGKLARINEAHLNARERGRQVGRDMDVDTTDR